MTYCTNCGTALSGTGRFCGTCGTPVEVPTAAPAPAPAPTPAAVPAPPPAATQPTHPPLATGDEASSDVPARSRSFPKKTLAVLATVLVVAGAAFAGATVLGGGSSEDHLVSYGGRSAVPRAVDSEPAKAWEFQAPDDATVVGAASQGAHTIVSWSGEDSSGVGAVDDSGDLSWQEDVDSPCYPAFTSSDDVVVCQTEGEEGASEMFAFDTSSGDQLWTSDFGYLYNAGSGEGALLSSGTKLRLVDNRSGETRWTVSGDTYALTDDAVYVLDGEDLSRVDLGSGKTKWSTPNVAEIDEEEGSASVAATDALVAVGSLDGVALYDAGGGDEKSSATGDQPDILLPFGDGFASVLTEYDDEGESSETTVSLIGEDGERDSESVDSETSPDGVLVTGGDELLFSSSGGDLYDTKLESRGRLPDDDEAYVNATGGGFYLTSEERTRFYDIDGQSQWTLDHAASTGQVWVVDRALLVSENDAESLSRYE